MNIETNSYKNNHDLSETDSEEHNYAVSASQIDNSNQNHKLNIKIEMPILDSKMDVKNESFIFYPNHEILDIKQELEPTTLLNKIPSGDDKDIKSITSSWSTVGKQEIGVAGVIRNIKLEVPEEEQSESSTSGVTNLNLPNSSIYKCNKCSLNFDDPQILLFHVKNCKASTNENEHKYSRHTIRSLIKNVSNHLCIYNKQHDMYNNLSYKKAIWDTIAVSCNLQNGHTAQTLWKEIKKDFIDFLNQNDPRKETKWHQYFKSLQFIIPFENNIPENSYTLLVDFQLQSVSDSSNEGVSFTSTNSPRKRPHLPDHTNHVNKKAKRIQEWKRLKEKITSHRKISHPLDTFFLSMCETTKNLPPHVQIQVKKQVFRAVVEAEDAALNSLNQQQSISSEDD